MSATKVSATVKQDDRRRNRDWLMKQMNPYFFVAMNDEPEAIALLEREMGTLGHNRRLVLADRDKSFIQAM